MNSCTKDCILLYKTINSFVQKIAFFCTRENKLFELFFINGLGLYYILVESLLKAFVKNSNEILLYYLILCNIIRIRNLLFLLIVLLVLLNGIQKFYNYNRNRNAF